MSGIHSGIGWSGSMHCQPENRVVHFSEVLVLK